MSKKCLSKASVILESAITPSLRGLLATILSGVLPIICFAFLPTAITVYVFKSIATTVGSVTTTPSPCTNMTEFAVPKSIPSFFPNIQIILQVNYYLKIY